MKLLKAVALAVPGLLLAVLASAMVMRLTNGARLLDPFLIVVVAQATRGRRSEAMAVGAVAGIVQDMLSSVDFGVHYLSKLVVGYVASLVATSLIPGQPLTAAVLLAGGTILEVIVQMLCGVLLGQHFNTPGLGELAVEVVANVAVGLVVFAVIDRFRQKRPRQVMHARGR